MAKGAAKIMVKIAAKVVTKISAKAARWELFEK